ncbi:MAG: hypothetical protein RIM72_00600 [Alphaproteobacteria bacterium]
MTAAMLNDRERQIRSQLKSDFNHYAGKCLKIRQKNGSIAPLNLNDAQRRVHTLIEEQRKRDGRVRMLILKARQWGCSTYVGARFYWRATHKRGMKAYVLTHRQEATDNLYRMIERFHANCPDLVKPSTGAANARSLTFGMLDSGYLMATAGGKATGRSDTVQLFHGSEVAFWPNAATHMAGVLQAVPDEDDTEIILESTANGVGGFFHDACMAALDGDSAFRLIFMPWFAHAAYTAKAGQDVVPMAAWAEYGAMHRLSPGQLAWAIAKNRDLARACLADPAEPCWMFRQEYPATVEEAFQGGGVDSLIRRELVLTARKATVGDQSHQPLVFGVDLARGGPDKTRIVDRQGRCAGHRVNVTMDTGDEMEIAGRLGRLIDLHNPAVVFVDATAGAGCVDRLEELGHRNIRKVNFGSKAGLAESYANKRAEMWGKMADWFADEGGADIPDSEEWQKHLCAPGFSYDSLSRLQLEKKEAIKDRLGFSPDLGDALALTFAETVHRPDATRMPVVEHAYDSLRYL